MTFASIEVEHEPSVRAAVITFARPQVHNAMNARMAEECLEAVESAMRDPAVRSLILTGKGERAFVAGADIEELRRRTPLTEVGPGSALRRRLARTLETGPKPVIAALNGHAVGGGLELALASTIRIAVPGAKLGLGEINLGIIPGNGATQRLVRMVGLGRAMELILTGRLITADEALAHGLVNKVVEPADLTATARDYAKTFAAKSGLALRAAKEAVMMACEVSLSAGLDFEGKWFAILNGGPDKQEGVEAFLTKRTAYFADDAAADETAHMKEMATER